jgi:hypothetical protein
MGIDSNTTNSILLCIKHKLGLDGIDYYDQDIIVDINMALMVLNQIGIGPTEPFTVKDSEDTWEDFLGSSKNYEEVKTLVYLKVKTIFDPPTSGILMQSMEKQISELQWRLYVKKDNEKGGNT